MIEDEIFAQIKSIRDKIRLSADQIFQKYDLTGQQAGYLAWLKKNNNVQTLKQIEQHFKVSHPTVTGIISRLEQKGFVTSSIDEKDRRNRIIRATERSKQLDIELEKTYQKLTLQLFKGMDLKEKTALKNSLEKLDKNLSETKLHEPERSDRK